MTKRSETAILHASPPKISRRTDPMKALQIIARGQCAFVDAPKPRLQPGSAIVKTLRLALCGSDVRHIHYLPDHRYPSPVGETGHEMVGIVEAIDPANGQVKPGDAVLCLAPDHRAMQEYYRAPIDRLLPIAPGTPLEHAVQAQQFGTVLFAAKFLPDLRGKTVAVIGQGSAGLWFNVALQRRNAAKSSPSISKPIASPTAKLTAPPTPCTTPISLPPTPCAQSTAASCPMSSSKRPAKKNQSASPSKSRAKTASSSTSACPASRR